LDHCAESPDDQETRPFRRVPTLAVDEQNLGEITNVEEFPGERLVVCRNPLVGSQRGPQAPRNCSPRPRPISPRSLTAWSTARCSVADQIGLVVGPALKRFRMKKHFQIAITDTTFTYTRDTAGIAAEAALDGF